MVFVIDLEYSLDLIHLYDKLAHLPGFCLLESTDKRHGRFDIVSAMPYKWLESDGIFTKIVTHKGQVIDKKSPFSVLKEHLPVQKELTSSLPFQGGAIGYISYDLGQLHQGIALKQKQCIAMPLMQMGFYDWALIADHRLEKLCLVVGFEDEYTPLNIKKVLTLLQSKAGDTAFNSFFLTSCFKSNLSFKAYEKAFYEVYACLEKGRCYQINLTQCFNASFFGDPWDAYKRLRQEHLVPHAGFLRYKSGDILSLSPEQFLSYENGIVQTKPIKGTKVRGTSLKEDILFAEQLKASEKNRAENIMIVDLSRHDLGKLAKPGQVWVDKLCEVESYATVHHLVSTIKASVLEGLNAIDIFSISFPAGSITGTPKLEAMRVISEVEMVSRHLYCGSLGYFSSHGAMEMNVAIRTLMASSNKAYLSCGGAIMMDSCVKEEHQESIDKIYKIVNILEKIAKI